ncbi:hypothetical protein HDC92_003799 [Pedobacter sp. AK017]|uniref:hypothetical protein n=1 Tax=Pedobacter sp. AK017 TaxID=2723073 RepID=UPI0016172AB0|nr:hypothetical protein [Pedobacter sp. AK017]MBB5440101.1 hypothetical protein [Pedobacter sp. AK017]
MITVTVLAIVDFETKAEAMLTGVMTKRLERFAQELQAYLEKVLQDERVCDELVVYLSYNSNYAIRWMVVNDVPEHVTDVVGRRCAKLGYVVWKGVDLYNFK